MSNNQLYPTLNILSKNELAKHISGNRITKEATLSLINDVIINFDRYWYDSKRSEPSDDKYVRSAVNRPLATLLDLINTKVLLPHDKKIFPFIYGGVSGRSHLEAAKNLIGKERGRTLLKIDIKRFFEQISEDRVFHFFHDKCHCSVRASKLIAGLCCVPIGPKGTLGSKKTIARGFPTSSRLAIWCNIGTFQKIFWMINRKLRDNDPRLSIFVDDIGISACCTREDEMEKVYLIVEQILNKFDKNQPLPVNPTKKKISTFIQNPEFLGLGIGRKKLRMGKKTQSKRDKVNQAFKIQQKAGKKNHKITNQRKGYKNYQKMIAKINKL